MKTMTGTPEARGSETVIRPRSPVLGTSHLWTREAEEDFRTLNRYTALTLEVRAQTKNRMEGLSVACTPRDLHCKNLR